MTAQFFILGATGDLTARYLMPAIASLRQQGSLPISEPVVGVGQDDWDTEQFRRHIHEKLKEHASGLSQEVGKALVQSLEYRQADVTDPAQLSVALGELRGPIAVYLALPPPIFAPVLRTLEQLQLPEDSRIVVEKPFGHDLASAQELNALLHRTFPEESVFRIDHFLGMQTVQNLLGLRFANRVFEYLWNRDHIERVEIVWDETVALEGRAGYYDTAGALTDMIQNHLLQLLCLVAMDAPTSFDQRDFRDRKLDVLRAVRRFSADQAARHTVRARYVAGRVGDRDVPNYVDEPGVQPERMTETYAQVTLFLDNWRWSQVPFVLRTGKALGANRHEIVVHFRPVPQLPFERSCPEANVLRLWLNPERLDLGININGPGDPFELERVKLETELAPHQLTAYARLLLDVFQSNAVLSIRGDEAEESWRIVEPILAAWNVGNVPLLEYPAGSAGLAAGNGR